MTTKKHSPRARRRATTIEERARAIIGSEQAADADTRRAVQNSLEELTVILERAEAGETILDMATPEPQSAPRWARSAAPLPLTMGRTLTPDHAARIVEGWALAWLCDDTEIGALLLLLRAFCYEPDAMQREEMLLKIEEVLMPRSFAACDVIDTLVADIAGEWQEKGGAQ